MTQIFVFGSNLQGIHGAGAALTARHKYGAKLGAGVGRTGNSYAIPTKRTPYDSLSLEDIAVYVKAFLNHATQHPELEFLITPIGTGRAGYTHQDIAPMFHGAPSNCILPKEWK